jgi:hypothetical protein
MRYPAPLLLFPPQNHDLTWARTQAAVGYIPVATDIQAYRASQEMSAKLKIVFSEKYYINMVPILSRYGTVYESWENANKIAD